MPGKYRNPKGRAELREEVYAAYGGAFCTCCGESEPVFLTLDHSHNDGAAHRKEVFGEKGGGVRFYEHLKKLGFPQDIGLRVMCFNCNCGRVRNEGICPHKEPRRQRKVEITEADVAFIREQAGQKGPRVFSDRRLTLQELSNKYGVSMGTISRIQKGRRVRRVILG